MEYMILTCTYEMLWCTDDAAQPAVLFALRLRTRHEPRTVLTGEKWILTGRFHASPPTHCIVQTPIDDSEIRFNLRSVER